MSLCLSSQSASSRNGQKLTTHFRRQLWPTKAAGECSDPCMQCFIPTLGNGFPSEAVLKRRPRVSSKSVRDGTMMIALLNLPCPGPSELDWCYLSPMNHQIAVHAKLFIHGIPDEQEPQKWIKWWLQAVKGLNTPQSSRHGHTRQQQDGKFGFR